MAQNLREAISTVFEHFENQMFLCLFLDAYVAAFLF